MFCCVCTVWWQHWQAAAGLLFTPRKKWLQATRPLQVGDVVMLLGQTKLGPNKYRLARVVRLLPGNDGVVRSVVISMRNRRGRGLQVEESTMAVQRLAVLLPQEEAWAGGLSESA